MLDLNLNDALRVHLDTCEKEGRELVLCLRFSHGSDVLLKVSHFGKDYVHGEVSDWAPRGTVEPHDKRRRCGQYFRLEAVEGVRIHILKDGVDVDFEE